MSGGGGMVCTKRMANPITCNIYYVNSWILCNHYSHLVVLRAMQFLQTTRCSGCLVSDLLGLLYIFKHMNVCISRA